jgi:hypothetical protein
VKRLATAVVLCAALVSGAAYAQESSGGAPPPSESSGSGAPNSITDRGTHTRDNDISLMAILPWYYGIGIGIEGRYEWFVAPDGFIPAVNDAFSIEASLGLSYSWWGVLGYTYSIWNITPAAYGIWSFYFSDKVRVYGGLGLGYNIGIYNTNATVGPIGANFFYWDLVAGVVYKVNPGIALRGEVGAQGLKGGITF